MQKTIQTPTERSIDRSATTLFFYCFLAYAFSYLGRQNFSACMPAMIAEGIIDKAWGGYITTAYMLVYGAGQLINGMGGTRIKPQYMIGTGLAGAGAMNILMGFVTSPWLMMLVWGCNGLFQSMLWAPVIRIFTDRLPKHKQYAAGVNIAPSVSVGTVLAYLVPGILLRFTDWRVVFWVAGIVLWIVFLVWTVGHVCLSNYIRYMDEQCQLERNARTEEKATVDKHRASFWTVMITTGLLLVLPCLVCFGALKDAVVSWIPTFFTEQFAMSEYQASLITVAVPVVSVGGAYVSTWLNKRWIRNELWTSGAMFLIALPCMLGVVLCNGRSAVLCVAFLAVAIAAMWGANTMFLTMLPYHFARLGLSSAVTGFFNCFAFFAVAACTSLYGVVASEMGWQTLTLIWLGLSVCGGGFCLVAGKVWAKRSKMLDEG